MIVYIFRIKKENQKEEVSLVKNDGSNEIVISYNSTFLIGKSDLPPGYKVPEGSITLDTSECPLVFSIYQTSEGLKIESGYEIEDYYVDSSLNWITKIGERKKEGLIYRTNDLEDLIEYLDHYLQHTYRKFSVKESGQQRYDIIAEYGEVKFDRTGYEYFVPFNKDEYFDISGRSELSLISEYLKSPVDIRTNCLKLNLYYFNDYVGNGILDNLDGLDFIRSLDNSEYQRADRYLKKFDKTIIEGWYKYITK